MLNPNGVLAVLDRHITLNWDDGPTLMRIGAAIHYRVEAGAGHEPDDANGEPRTLLINASSRCGDDPPCFNAFNERDGISATWTWTELPPGYAAQLTISNIGEADLRLVAIDLLSIDGARGGVFNLGAPASTWTTISDASETATALQTRDGKREFVVLANETTRSRPTAIAFAVPAETFGAQFSLDHADARFQAFRVRVRFDEPRLLGEGALIALPEVRIASGDDARELRDAV
jgi:hypothetical protein